ncbi:hypothetical protein BDV98DRAFT_548329 [Pterulicium gracile]|uniref:Uncharacterized protein n=1 Tax=Pterulicium gracile TaxID=1884261 RepID=A0A5C3QJZ9_9AGAR|nr:hypothetical protein BDV98DRAFT_548329 [Pterula gracilis]
MTDLTYCYLHMTRNELLVLDTLETPDYIDGSLSDDAMDIPLSMVPPNPEESDILPSQVHPSYPYGNPTMMDHPSTQPRHPWDPSSRALFEDMDYEGGGVNGLGRWNELALEELLPVDEEKETAKRAAEARKMASGATGGGQPPPQAAPVLDPGDSEEGELDENNDLEDYFEEDDTEEFV